MRNKKEAIEGFGARKDEDKRKDRKHDTHALPAKSIDSGLASAEKFWVRIVRVLRGPSLAISPL